MGHDDNEDERLTNFRELLNARLATKAEVIKLSESVRLSVPTVYRYKKEPGIVPLGMYLRIKKYFNQLENQPEEVFPSPDDFVKAELQRLSLEQNCLGGERFVVTPVFSVNCEIEEVTRVITEYDYPTHKDWIDEFVKVRQHRRKEYERGIYKSNELIDASKYRDFFLGVNRFANLTRKCIEKQIENLVETTKLNHVDRRIYLYNTPELPVISCYQVKKQKNNMLRSILRADNFVATFSDTNNHIEANELLKTFIKYFEWETNLKNKEDVIRFLKNPMVFPMF